MIWRLVEIGEQVLVETLVTQAAVEALDEAILHRFARRDVVPLDAAILFVLGIFWLMIARPV